MGKARRTPRRRTRKHHNHNSAGDDVGSSSRVEHLRRHFAKFRRTHPLRTRIPDSLRQAALAALKSGAAESEVRQACGVTSNQLAQWRKNQKGCEPQCRLENPEPRIFPVVDGTTGLLHTKEPEQQDLELRIGDWAICIRQLQR